MYHKNVKFAICLHLHSSKDLTLYQAFEGYLDGHGSGYGP